ncbi:hypothetical protein PSENEW3_00000285 [Picochlorum sp. SENEW3]|nr:hypothetical protein PSENEW3_00000285 [Picochlorum sp. SENEW3]
MNINLHDFMRWQDSTSYLRSSVADQLFKLGNKVAFVEAQAIAMVKKVCAEYVKPNHGNLNAETIVRLESEEGWDWTDGGKEYLADRRKYLALGTWIILQRLEYASTNHGRLSAWHIQKLQKLRGWRWSGNFRLSEINLMGSWIEKQRREYAKPNHGHLSKVDVRKLESFPGWTWSGPLGWREEATRTQK